MIKRSKRLSHSIEILNTPQGSLNFQLTRSPHRRSIAITIKETAQVQVSAPLFVPKEKVFAFIHEKEDWIFAKLKKAEEFIIYSRQRRFRDGSEFLFLGKKYPLKFQPHTQRKIKIFFDGQKWQILIPAHQKAEEWEDKISRVFCQWYQSQAREILGSRLFHCARLMKVAPQQVAIRTQKRLWGICHYHSQKIHLNWKIVLAPLDVIDYVIVHELCHLSVPNHSRKFWSKVRQFHPNFEYSRQWLKDHTLDLVLPHENGN